MSAKDLLDLCMHIALTAVGVFYRDKNHCKFPIATYLIVSGCTNIVYALIRILNANPNLCGVPTSNLQPLTSCFFTTWGYGLTATRLRGWSVMNKNAPGYCHLAPMSAGSFANLVHAIYLCSALLSLAGVLVTLATVWMITYSFIVAPLLNSNNIHIASETL